MCAFSTTVHNSFPTISHRILIINEINDDSHFKWHFNGKVYIILYSWHFLELMIIISARKRPKKHDQCVKHTSTTHTHIHIYNVQENYIIYTCLGSVWLYLSGWLCQGCKVWIYRRQPCGFRGEAERVVGVARGEVRGRYLPTTTMGRVRYNGDVQYPPWPPQTWWLQGHQTEGMVILHEAALSGEC